MATLAYQCLLHIGFVTACVLLPVAHRFSGDWFFCIGQFNNASLVDSPCFCVDSSVSPMIVAYGVFKCFFVCLLFVETKKEEQQSHCVCLCNCFSADCGFHYFYGGRSHFSCASLSFSLI